VITNAIVTDNYAFPTNNFPSAGAIYFDHRRRRRNRDGSVSDFHNYTVANAFGFVLDPSNIVIDPRLNATFHLKTTSPAIDGGGLTAAPDHDIDRRPRLMVGTSGRNKVDIGVDEYKL